MNKLKHYEVTIPEEDKWWFLDNLSKVSKQSGVRVGKRLNSIHTIISETAFTVFGVSLSDDELIILKLSCPGKYVKEETEYQ